LWAESNSSSPLGYDFVANLPHAHHTHQGILVDFNEIGASKYLRDFKRRFVYQKNYKKSPALWGTNIRSSFWVPFSSEMASQDLTLDMMLAPFGSGQRVDVFIAGKKIKNIVFKETGWQNIRVKIKANQVKEGIHEVRFHFRKRVATEGVKATAAFRALRISFNSLDPFSADMKDLEKQLTLRQKEAISLSADHGVDYYLVPPKSGSLDGTLNQGDLSIWAKQDGKKAKKLKTKANGSFSISLAQFKGQPTRFSFIAGSNGALFRGGFTPKIGSKLKAKAPKHVIFWLIDTLRADKLEFYKTPNANGRKKVKTPNLSKLAQTATIFEPFYVQGNESKASHASLFTGVYPIQHKVYTHKAKLSSSLTTIAELFKSNGYRTGGFVSNGYVSDKWNFDQGFQDFTNFIRENKGNNAKYVVRSATKWIKKNKKKNFYLYLGTSDPHVTYCRYKEFIKIYDDKTPYKGRYNKNITGGELGKLKEAKSPPSQRDQTRIEALYENEIAFNDFHFGKLVEFLKKEGLYDETLIIVSADHGDEFWEHGSCGHGHSLYQELISVPLMIHWPHSFPASRFEAGVDGIDLLPTLNELLNQKPLKKVQGRSVLSHLNASSYYPQAIMASKGTEQFALSVGPAKVIFRGRGSLEAYNTSLDRNESKDQSKTHPILLLSALDPLSIYLTRPKTWNKAQWGAPNALSSDFPKGFPKAWSK
jgi:arylsulfatase A-like enzyme